MQTLNSIRVYVSSRQFSQRVVLTTTYFTSTLKLLELRVRGLEPALKIAIEWKGVGQSQSRLASLVSINEEAYLIWWIGRILVNDLVRGFYVDMTCMEVLCY